MLGPIYKRWEPPAVSSLVSKPATKSNNSTPAPTTRAISSDAQEKYSPLPAYEPSEQLQIRRQEVVQLPKRVKKRKTEPIASTDSDEHNTIKKHKTLLSKFEKVAKKAETRKLIEPDADETAAAADQQTKVLRDLEPLPQPAPIADVPHEPSFSVLPDWLAHPHFVEASKRLPFQELSIQPFFLKRLSEQGFTRALAVQTALLPLLHEGYNQHLGDLCVAAKTGSGKTLAYLLPIVEALKESAGPTLSAIIIVPTRKLVDQAVDVAQLLCEGTTINIGTALGASPLATEQEQLVKRRATYDPDAARLGHELADQQMRTGYIPNQGVLDDLMAMPLDHVPHYESGVNILICTPGRLVEHLEYTTGFTLAFVRWLVIDEADQLLDQDFQGWASILIDNLRNEPQDELLNACKSPGCHGKIRSISNRNRRKRVSKIVLSATMETDLTKLGLLDLCRPKFIDVRNQPHEQHSATAEAESFELPSSMEEFAVAVGDGQKKPLYLLYLLMTHIFAPDDELLSTDTEPRLQTIQDYGHRALVFTKSNESASRLAHLLTVLEPSLQDTLKVMTPAATAKSSRKLLKSFGEGAFKILIASDAASRGLDIPGISHVINYDMPSSIVNYVHRVGRTARADNAGEAWTLFTKMEAAWFWKQVAKDGTIRRNGHVVKRVSWKAWNVTFDRKKSYEAALADLQKAVQGSDDAG